ncbi:transcription factor Opi1-domain-containing protein [Mycena sp. CBHHK59/15]|nr:transcription factor Opi1-domain-containing protein [Mycena sp. CBHHK59/15]
MQVRCELGLRRHLPLGTAAQSREQVALRIQDETTEDRSAKGGMRKTLRPPRGHVAKCRTALRMPEAGALANARRRSRHFGSTSLAHGFDMIGEQAVELRCGDAELGPSDELARIGVGRGCSKELALLPCGDGLDATEGLHGPQHGDRHRSPDAKLTSKTLSAACVGLRQAFRGAVCGATEPCIFHRRLLAVQRDWHPKVGVLLPPGADWLRRHQIHPRPLPTVCAPSFPPPMTTMTADLDSDTYVRLMSCAGLGPGGLRFPTSRARAQFNRQLLVTVGSPPPGFPLHLSRTPTPTTTTPMDLELEDEDVRIAVRALGDMRSGTNAGAQPVSALSQKPHNEFVFPPAIAHNTHPHPSPNTSSASTSASTSHTPALSLSLTSTHPGSSPPHTPPLDDADARRTTSENDTGDPAPYSSLARMSSLPLVSGALRVYEAGKANSRVVQYTSSLVSTSLRHASSRLPAGSGERMDEFAGGMLDRLEKYRRPVKTKTLDGSPAGAERGWREERERDGYREGEQDSYRGDERERDRDGYREGYSDERRYREPDAYREGEGYREEGYREEGYTEDGCGSTGKRRVPGWLEATSPFVPSPAPPPGFREREEGRPPPPSREDRPNGENQQHAPTPDGEHAPTQGGEVAQRSRWHAMLLEAGGLSAALSDESMRRLRYCLQWLQYATQHIDAQILILRDFIASLSVHPSSAASSSSSNSTPSLNTSKNGTYPDPPELTPDHLRTLAHLRSDIVHTIRQVVGVVSRYAGGALPEPARGRVRGFILGLPRRLGAEDGGGGGGGGGNGHGGSASATASGVGGATGVATGTAARRGARRERGAGAVVESPTVSRPGSPRPRHGVHSRHGSGAGVGGGGGPVEPGKAMAAAQRVLALATESLDMMRGVTAVVGESLDRADAWVDRLRTVGIQRGMDGLALPEGSGERAWTGPLPAWRDGAGSSSVGGSVPHSPREPYLLSPHIANAHSPRMADARSPHLSSVAHSPHPANAPSPGFGLGGMSLGSRYPTPAPGAPEEEGEGEGGMEVDG